MLKPKTCADLADKQAISLLLVKEDAQVEPPEEEPQTSVAGDVGIYMEVWLTASGWLRDWHECDLPRYCLVQDFFQRQYSCISIAYDLAYPCSH